MYAPVLVTPPSTLPVSVAEAMRQCRIDPTALDATASAEVTALLDGYIAAAVGHIEGWTGILSAVIAEQTWSQAFDAFSRELALPLGPVIAITDVSYRNLAGVSVGIDSSFWLHLTDAAGQDVCRFLDGFSAPSDLAELRGVTVTYRAGYPTTGTAIRAIKQAILLTVGAWYENREETVIGVQVASLPDAVAVDRLLFPHRRKRA